MEASGIVRRVDDLGRIVIPKEIRSNLRIKSGECLEIYTVDDKIFLKKQDMIRFLQANSSYIMKPSLANTTAKIAILAGGKEQKIMRRSAEILYHTIPGSRMQILDQYYHGDLSLNHPMEYVELLSDLFKENR